jgi:hypothetical protein
VVFLRAVEGGRPDGERRNGVGGGSDDDGGGVGVGGGSKLPKLGAGELAASL